MFRLIFTESSIEDLHFFKKSEQVQIVEAIEKQLSAEPLTETRNRKPLRPNNLAKWELRVDKYRIFYDVDIQNRIIKIKAIGWKKHNILLIRNQEFEL